MARDGLMVYHEVLNWLEPYGDAERGRLLTAMLTYSMTGEIPELRGNERFIWPAIMARIDRDVETYEAKCKRMVANGSKSHQKVAIGSKSSPTTTTTTTTTATTTTAISPSENKHEKAFVPPALEDVRAYCSERGSCVDPEEFWEYYNAGHWKDSKGNPVRNWKQKLLIWEKKARESEAERPKPKKTNNIFMEMLMEREGGI